MTTRMFFRKKPDKLFKKGGAAEFTLVAIDKT